MSNDFEEIERLNNATDEELDKIHIYTLLYYIWLEGFYSGQRDAYYHSEETLSSYIIKLFLSNNKELVEVANKLRNIFLDINYRHKEAKIVSPLLKKLSTKIETYLLTTRKI